MGFLAEFEAYFTPEEKESEIFKILSVIGVNNEKAILEEYNANLRQSTELMAYPDDRLRSWLAAFLRRVRNVVSARGYGEITVLSSPGNKLVSIPAGSEIAAKNGKTYQLAGSAGISLYPGQSLRFRFIQGELKVATGTYDEIIAIPALGVDLGDIQVFIENVEIPPVPEVSPAMDVVGDLLKLIKKPVEEEPEEEEEPEPNEEVSLESIFWVVEGVQNALKRVFIRPQNGYYAFYYDSVLYVKIYRGDDVGDPTGKSWTVSYRVSDGALGNIGRDQFQEFRDVSELKDVEYELSNDPVNTGVGAPTHSELVNLLREKFFVTTNVASVPEYTAWFMARPEVGDCLVISDYERWRDTGYTSLAGFSISGSIDVFLMGIDRLPLVEGVDVVSLGNGISSLEGTLKTIDDALMEVRDVASITYRTYEMYQHYFVVQFSSTSNDEAFMSSARTIINNFYDLEYVRLLGTSLFQALDMELVQKAIGVSYSPVGLRIIPFHYEEKSVSLGTLDSFETHQGEVGGGWYEYWERRDGILEEVATEDDYSLKVVFREFLHEDGSCSIYVFDKNNAGASWTPSSVSGGKVGTRTVEGRVSFYKDAFAGLNPGLMRCFWAIKNQGMFPVGSFAPSEFGARQLPLGSKFSDGGVRFEKY